MVVDLVDKVGTNIIPAPSASTAVRSTQSGFKLPSHFLICSITCKRTTRSVCSSLQRVESDVL